VRWQGLPQGIEEMELLVSLDGGRFARVADLEPSARSYTWLVPSLPAERAVLAIRGRVDGRETLLVETRAFVIEGRGEPGLEPVSYHGGELWTDTAGSATPLAPEELTDSCPTALGRPGADEPAEDSSGFDRTAPALSSDEPAAAGGRPSEPARQPSRPRSPLAFPRRN